MSLLSALAPAASTVLGLFGLAGSDNSGKTAPAVKPLASALKPPTTTAAGQNALLKKIHAAVAQALSSLTANGAASPSAADTNKAIQKAIVGVLNEAADGSILPNDPADKTAAAATSQASDTKAFNQLLAAHGVDDAQFQADMKAAFQQVQQSGVNVPNLLSAFAKGSAVDVLG